jgi:hypothetical protein
MLMEVDKQYITYTASVREKPENDGPDGRRARIPMP